jgi:hypothetical protein
MDYTIIQVIGIAAVLIGAGLAFTAWRRYRAADSRRRRTAMLEAVGLDPALAAIGDLELIMSEVRQRCEQCQSEALCERWLKGEETGGNEFCPNKPVFDVLHRLSP